MNSELVSSKADADHPEDDLKRWWKKAETADSHLAGAAADAACRAELLRHLLACREDQRLSQTAVARLMETTQSAVSELEGGLTDPRLSTLQRYARAVSCQLYVHLARDQYTNWQTLEVTSAGAVSTSASASVLPAPSIGKLPFAWHSAASDPNKVPQLLISSS
jgi:transcriptional regulator with XRE-family HTH domain